jgi:hypothetical protein
LNIAFVIGDIDDPTLDAPNELFAAAVVNLVATGLKISDHSCRRDAPGDQPGH